MGRAYAIAVGDRGEPLHVRAEQADEHVGFCLAQLREVDSDVGDRAVVLADLDAGTGLLRRRRVAVGGERGGQLGWTQVRGTCAKAAA